MSVCDVADPRDTDGARGLERSICVPMTASSVQLKACLAMSCSYKLKEGLAKVCGISQ